MSKETSLKPITSSRDEELVRIISGGLEFILRPSENGSVYEVTDALAKMYRGTQAPRRKSYTRNGKINKTWS
jgi:hypothetical protein